MNISAAIDNKSKHLELKKHVNAIHCTNNLTLVQRKLFNALLFNAYPELPHKTRLQIHTRQLCELIGYNSNDYGKLKKALLGLITIAIEWNVIDTLTGKENTWKASSILASAELKDGYCNYEYSHVMKELLYQPDIYGRINIVLVAQFKSNYGLALYENCIRYQGLPQTPWFSLDIFRKLMGVFEGKYSAFKDFKKRVINVAVKEVNTISPIYVHAEIERKNQKPTRIRFKLSKKLPEKKEKPQKDMVDDELGHTLSTTFGFSDQLIKQFLSDYDQGYIKEKVAIITQSDNFLSGKIRSLSAYLIEAIKKDYKADKSSKKIVETSRRKQEEAEEKLRKKEDKRQDRYNTYVSSKINEYISKLSKLQYMMLIEDFEEHMRQQNGILQGWYRKHELNHPATRSVFSSFIKEKRKSELGQILSYEEFVSLIEKYN